jgi:hypothetical protein
MNNYNVKIKLGESMKNKKMIVTLLLVIGLVSITLGVSVAFFNYTRTGSENVLAVGRIYFASNQGTSINLTNVFPVKSEELGTDTNNHASVTLTVTGDTTYDEGIEYLVSAVDVSNTTNNKQVPIGVSVSVNNIGTSDDSYFTNRGGNTSIYKILSEDTIKENGELVVGYITKGATGVNGSITVTAYIDADRIAISDTYDGTESDNNGTTTDWVDERTVLTTTEWNSFNSTGLSFKVKVEANEGIWVKEPLKLSQVIAGKASTASYIASYDDIIQANPTFTTQDQVSDSAPKQTVYYFTGDDAAANANVLFAGYCWQIIRTTDNGGVRMIYNGVAVNNKCETTRTATKGINGQKGTTQSMSAATRYGRSYDYDLDTGEFTIENSTGLPTSWTTSDANSNGTEDYKELIGTYTCLSNSATCTTLYYVGSINQSNTAQAYVSKYTIGDVAHYSQMGTSAFNSNYGSPAMVGYMFNTEYDYKQGSKSGEYYTTATWNGTTYDLTSSNNGSAPDVEHHYICDSDCTKVRYYYYSTNYYILLEHGATVEDAIYKMTGNGTVETKSKTINANYELNNYNSAMKGYLDNWYKKNLTGYTSFLDGTSVYCNDRSIRELRGWNPTNSLSLTTTLQFYQYSANSDLNCVNEWDRFAVTNTKAELTYPIGLLTEPERNLMTNYFARTRQDYWGASPYDFYVNSADVRSVSSSGVNGAIHVGTSYGARGVVSLSPGTKLENGTGTYTDPYIVGPIVTRSE